MRNGQPERIGARRAVVPLLAAFALAGCRGAEPQVLVVRAEPTPGGRGSALPRWERSGASPLLSWTEPIAVDRSGAAAGRGYMLRYARWQPAGWGPVRTAATGADWIVNAADLPSVTALSERGLLAHWLRRRTRGGYDIMLAVSLDGGARWSAPWTPHRDDTDTEHGFVSVVPAGDGGALVLWLDGRAFAGHDEATAERHGAMALRARAYDGAALAALAAPRSASVVAAPDPALALAEPEPDAGERVLDPRTCSCCQTAAVAVAQDVVVAYRARRSDEVRDIAVVRLRDGRWSEPAMVHDDGWRIDGCPVNGPAIAAAGARVAVAWYTEADGAPQVKIALSQDGGESFAAPLRIDDGQPMGRVDVAFVGEGAAVSWQERRGDGLELRLRLVRAGGAEPSQRLPVAPTAKPSGAAQLAAAAGQLLVAWTEQGADGASHVRSARVTVPR
jgi:hypothetical protein